MALRNVGFITHQKVEISKNLNRRPNIRRSLLHNILTESVKRLILVYMEIPLIILCKIS